MKYILSFVLLLMLYSSYSQCDSNRHNSTLSSNWVSCEISPNPNPIRGDSHWINYDLGETKKLNQARIWNISNPAYIEEGARQIAVDYSLDGINWEIWGIWEVPIAEPSGFYVGVEGPDFEGLQTRFVLLTILNNHGGECSGFGEIKIDVEESTNTSETLAEVIRLEARPNPASERTILNWTSNYSGEGKIEIMDMTGRVVDSKEITLTKGEVELEHELDMISIPGQYLIKVITPVDELLTELTIIKTK